MAPKILLGILNRMHSTGFTGYVGGTASSMMYDSHPQYDYKLCIRNPDRAKIIVDKFPDVKFVYGDLNSVDVSEKAASEADVVVHTAESADSPGAAKDIAKGRFSSHTVENLGYYLHLSGAGILTWYDIKHKRYGEPPLPKQKYNDRILELPGEAIHKNVEDIVQSIDSDIVKCIIVSPPVIYGARRGIFHKHSFAVTEIVRATFDLGYTPIIGAGKAK
ncbi:hypothetical protein ACLX1H_002196 [Fusarium chlamydosporum]